MVSVFDAHVSLELVSTLKDSTTVPFASKSLIVPVPFYGLELLIGLLQAAVFMLLCAVYIQLSTSHDEEEEH